MISKEHKTNNNIEKLSNKIETKEKIEIKSPKTDKNEFNQRLIITKMVLQNFKSYKGKHTIGPFHKKFSSIVGPNGSGKSNVIDALLFVFGKRASEIRFKKVTELIHRSDDTSKFEFCSVSIHFETILEKENITTNTSKPLHKTNSFIITRQVNNKGISKYLINNQKSSFSEISDFLKTQNIDLNNNRFLILQGEVESIAQMKPIGQSESEKGLLEYLEEIIGSNRFVHQIEESSKKLELLNDQRQESLNRVKVVEKEKEALEESRSEARDYLQKDWKLLTKKAIFQQIHIFRLKENEKKIFENNEKYQKQEKEVKEALEEQIKESSVLSQKFDEVKRVFDKLNESCKKLMEKFKHFEVEDEKVNIDTVFEKKREKKIKNSLKKEENKLTQFQESINMAKVEVPKLETESLRLSNEKAKEEKVLEQMFSRVKEKTGPIRQKLEQKQKQLVPFKGKVNQCQHLVDITSGEIKMYTQKSENSFSKLNKINEEIKKISSKIQENTNLVKNTFKCNLKNDKQNLQKSKTELIQIKKDLEELEPKIFRLQTITNEAKSAIETSKQTHGLLGRLMKAKQKGLIEGIEGRLGDLGTIDSKFDIAISTAAGALHNILVENAETGQKCVRFLKEHKLGRATFMMLDKQKQRFEGIYKKRIQTPENVVRIFDQIKPKNDRYLPAFYSALRDTLFAENIDQAVRVSNANGRRWRVVTAKGELVDTSGTMSGGGRQVRRGAMSSKMQNDCEFTEEQLRRYEKELFQYQNKQNEVKSRNRQLIEEIRHLESKIQKCSLLSQKTEIEIEDLVKRKRELLTFLKPNEILARKTKEENDKNIFRLNEKYLRYEKDLKKAKKNTESLEKECHVFEEQIMNSGGKQLRKQKEKVEKLSENFNLIHKRIAELNVDSSGAHKKIKQSKTRILELEKEILVVRDKIELLSKRSLDIENKATLLLEEHSNQKQKKSEQEKILDETQNAFKKYDTEINQNRLILVDIEDKRADFIKAKKDTQNKLTLWQNKLNETLTKTQKSEEILTELLNTKKISNKSKRSNKNEENNSKFEPFTLLNEEQIEKIEKTVLENEIYALESDIKRMNPNMGAIEEYRRKTKEYSKRVGSLSELTAERDLTRALFEELRQSRLNCFMEGFSVITMKLKEMYQMLTLGGDAELECVDTLDPFSEGIEFSVRPPKKSWKKISNLSGGEKTLSSLALVFALHHYKPTPLYVMDEIDAALDFKNVSIVANYIKDRTENAQFVIISLRNNMFEIANRLVGIYKTNDASKTLTIDPNSFQIPIKMVNTEKLEIENKKSQNTQKKTNESLLSKRQKIVLD